MRHFFAVTTARLLWRLADLLPPCIRALERGALWAYRRRHKPYRSA